MIFTFIIFAVALMMEMIGSYISVIGLSSLFAGDMVILVMAVVLDVAKVTSVSFLYKNWKELKRAMKGYFLVAVIVLMTITSAGAFGYLSNAFQKAVQPNKELSLKLDSSSSQIDALTKELSDLATQRSKLDSQVAAISPDLVTARKRLLTSFKSDYDRINARTTTDQASLDKLKADQLTLQTANVDKEVHIGPIAYVAKAFGVTMDRASTYIISVITLVFDPLAIMLILAGNFSLENYRKAKTVGPEPEPVKPTSKSDDAYDPTAMTEDPWIAPTAEQIERSKKAWAQETYDENQHETVVEPVHEDFHVDLAKLDHAEPIHYQPIILQPEVPMFVPVQVEEEHPVLPDGVEIVAPPFIAEDFPEVLPPEPIEEIQPEPEFVYTGPLAIDGYQVPRTIDAPTLAGNEIVVVVQVDEEKAKRKAMIVAMNAAHQASLDALNTVVEPVVEQEITPEIEAINIAIDSGEFVLDPEILSKVVITDEPELVIEAAGDEISKQRAMYE